MPRTLGRDIMLDPETHDLAIENGDLTVGVSVRQAVKINLMFVRGEWFANRQKGIPYFERVWIKPVNVNHLRALFRRAITDTPGVDRVIAFALAFNAGTRTLSIDWTATTNQGELTGSEILSV